MRALVAIDGSESALHALHRTRAIFADATLVLVCVVAPLVDPNEGAGGFAGPTMTPEEAERDHTAQVVAADATLAEAARSLGPEPLDQRVVVGSPADAIAALAAELAVDVVVIGSPGHSLLERAFTGSAGHSILHAAPTSVLIVPAPAARSV